MKTSALICLIKKGLIHTHTSDRALVSGIQIVSGCGGGWGRHDVVKRMVKIWV